MTLIEAGCASARRHRPSTDVAKSICFNAERFAA
jgi:hypothetical protein